ncbi:MAG: ATP-binding protein [Anaerolineae bacterium]|nr:ATP-binding protein [Anaerolineae bacterium]
MVDVSLLRELLAENEGTVLDFKAAPYHFDDERSTSKFIKDILAMANTPRDEPAYIIVGVAYNPDGSRDLLGVEPGSHLDDADLQNKLNLAKVEPKPAFVYQPMTLDGLSYGVIEIPVQAHGPYIATKDYGIVKAHHVYFRRGSQNDYAVNSEERRDIYRWFNRSREAEVPVMDESTPTAMPNWDEFMLACHRFDASRLYVLIVGPDLNNNKDNW